MPLLQTREKLPEERVRALILEKIPIQDSVTCEVTIKKTKKKNPGETPEISMDSK